MRARCARNLMRVFAATLQHAFVSDRMARAKDVLSSYRVELRQVLKDVGKGTFAEYDAKGMMRTPNPPFSVQSHPDSSSPSSGAQARSTPPTSTTLPRSWRRRSGRPRHAS